jgi:WD40 repeat protein
MKIEFDICQKGEPGTVFRGHSGYINCLDGYNSVIFSGSDDHTIRSWEVKVRKFGGKSSKL